MSLPDGGMTVEQLIDVLSKCPPDAPVIIWAEGPRRTDPAFVIDEDQISFDDIEHWGGEAVWIHPRPVYAL